MVQNTNATVTKAAGRPPAFDADEVVEAAIDLFWRQGYRDTSLADLEQALGVNRSTLYNSFEGKAGLFRSAVARYFEELDRELVAPLLDGDGGLTDLLAFTEHLRELLTDPAVPSGCLVVNSFVSGDAPGAPERYDAMMRGGFEAALRRASDRGEVSDDLRRARSAAMLSAVIGVNTASKSGMPAAGIHELIAGLESVIRGWGTDVATD